MTEAVKVDQGYDKRITDIAALAASAAGKNANVAPQLLMAHITFALADAVSDGRLLLPYRENAGEFSDWSAAALVGQCRMQARENIDPEYSQFMLEVADRLASLARDPQPAAGETEAITWLKVEFEAWETRAAKAKSEVVAFSRLVAEPGGQPLQPFVESWQQTADHADKMLAIYAALLNIVRDRDEWREQHENLLSVRQSDLAALATPSPRADEFWNTEDPDMEILAHALREGSWAEVIAALIRIKSAEECETELAASQNTLRKWMQGSKLRPMTEQSLRKTIAEWVGISTPPRADRFVEMERDHLREVVATYIDRLSLGTIREDLQQAADDAIVWANAKGIRPRGEATAEIMLDKHGIRWPHPCGDCDSALPPRADREAIAREALERSQKVIRAQHIGHGALGGSCGLCGSNWLDPFHETHSDRCLIADNAAILKLSGEWE